MLKGATANVQYEQQVAEPTIKFFRSRLVAKKEKTAANATSTLVYSAIIKLAVASFGNFVGEGSKSCILGLIQFKEADQLEILGHLYIKKKNNQQTPTECEVSVFQSPP